MQLLKIILKPGKEQSIKRFHPWIFSGAIKHLPEGIKEGAVVELYSAKDEYLATGHYQIGSIAVRILSFLQEKIDLEFWEKKISIALQVRSILGLTENPDTNVFRLVNAEGDGMPGLIADYYNGTLVLQFHSVGMYMVRNELIEAFGTVLGFKLKAIYDKSETTLPFKAGLNPVNQYLYGSPETDMVKENGLQFIVNWESGQKTGFFIDQ
ncbi:MAG: class I SAM-dependent rRNA methyltransferase, partial [Bacteroidia bacterium]|nr:class I SAM-dependent rRNA methyltransferase [Bacteroidia bacterium]